MKKNNGKERVSKRKRYVLTETTPFIITEAYNMARTNLTFALATSDKNSIVFTSCNPAEGKSTNCVNFAITLANAGSKVLLIDSDLRKPTMHKLLKLANNKGLSSIISGQCSINDARNLDVRPNLDVITAGPIPPNPSELLSSQIMVTCLDLLSKKYDYICIDTPPINVVSDALLYNNLTAGIIFIVKENYTHHGDITSALDKVNITNGKVLGIIKTACNPEEKGSHSYSYKYKYEYSTPTSKTDSASSSNNAK